MGRTRHVHDFDPDSGWCASCGTRDDMRLVNRDGDVWREGRPPQLEEAGNA